MSSVTVEQILQLVEQLPDNERLWLIERLQIENESDVTREQLIWETEQLRRAGAFEKAESLMGKFATEGVAWTEEELSDYLRQI